MSISLRLIAGIVFLSEQLVFADVLVDHQPYISGGPAADTMLIDDFGRPAWELLADDFTLAAPAVAQRLSFWGFYGSSFSCNIQPPAGDETMRVRLYDSRPGDGFPGQILFEESFLNPSRADTGRIVGVGCGPHEFRYQVDLSNPLAMGAGLNYWLEVVQVGDPNSEFRWEFSVTGGLTGFSYLNERTTDWQHTVDRPTESADLAFQISTPEPTNFGLLLLITWLAWTRARNNVVIGGKGGQQKSMPNLQRR